MKQLPTSHYKEIFETYQNGNISGAKAAVRKLTKAQRKTMYLQVSANFSGTMQDCVSKDALFFFHLI